VNRRGQVTVFIIVGIIVLAISAAIFYIASILQTDSIETAELETYSALTVKASFTGFVESCLSDTVGEGLFLLGFYGGLIYPEENPPMLVTEDYLINYAEFNDISGFSNLRMEEDLARYVTENIYLCFDEFSEFEKQGMTIEGDEESMSARILILDNIVQAELNYPVKIILPDDDKVEFDSFLTEVDTNYGDMLNLAEEISTDSDGQLNPNTFIDSDYFVTVFPFDASNTIYTITDEETLVNDAPLTLMFAVKNANVEHPPELAHISNIAIQEGSVWSYQMYAEDSDGGVLTFSSDSSKFPVSEKGKISATVNGVGTYYVTFTVTDSTGLSDSQEVKVTIIESLSSVEDNEVTDNLNETINETGEVN